MKKISGVSLIEILMAMMFISLALLGMDAMELSSLCDIHHAYFYEIAVRQIQTIKEIISSEAEYDASIFEQWQQQNKNSLPQGNGAIHVHFPFYQINLCWGKKPECLYEQIRVS